MTGQTISTRLEEPSETIWKGFIEVKRKNNKHSYKIDSLAPLDPDDDQVIKEALSKELGEIVTELDVQWAED